MRDAATKSGKEKNTMVKAKASKGKGFTASEKDAMRQRIKELQTGKGETEPEVLAKIAEMSPSDRAMAERIHSVIKKAAPVLTPKLWYGMPAYYREGKAVCFFQPATKFKTRYAELGFNDAARLDEGEIWPVAYAFTTVTGDVEAKIAALVKKAVG